MDTYTVALPIARECGVPFVVFVCPQLIDQELPFWPEQLVALIRATQPSTRTKEIEMLIENLKLATPEQREAYLAKLRETMKGQATSVEARSIDRTLSWAAIAEMHQKGISFGSHTQTHQILTAIPLDVACKEVRTSKAAIESALAEDCDTFAYPNGNWSPETREILAEAGFKLAVTTTRGAWTTGCDYLAIPRANVCEDNVTGPRGRFSKTMFEYDTFWKAWRATKAQSRMKVHRHPRPAQVTV
jgi:peptidoglycan/xylan/chitin deacetylase (PgdA/CDA1 family)